MGSAGGKRPSVIMDYRDWAHSPDFPTDFADLVVGNWYPWSEGVNGNAAGQYVPAYRRVVSLFRSIGVTNVTWVWSPNVAYPGSVPTSRLFPGDAYVDWTALDGYNWGTTKASGWQSFEQVFGPSITQVRALSAKPLVLAEIGSAEQGGDKAAWITDFFSRLAARPEVRGFLWFNHDKEADWRVQSSDASRIAYAAAVASSRYV